MNAQAASGYSELKEEIMNRNNWRELAVFGLLLAIGVLGRWAQPDWNFTPLAAITIIGGYYFRNWMPAVLLPVSTLAVSDIVLPAHDSWAVLLAVHLMMIVPLALGRLARGAEGWQAAWRWGMCGIVPATTFYLVTNFAVWAFTGMYDKTLSGLAACYVAAIPFYRTMLAGDLFYLVVLGSCLAIASMRVTSREPSVARS